MKLTLGVGFCFFSVSLPLPYKRRRYVDIKKNEAWPNFALAAELDYSARTLFAVPALMVCLCYHLAELFQREKLRPALAAGCTIWSYAISPSDDWFQFCYI